jgi:hypothetical protein
MGTRPGVRFIPVAPLFCPSSCQITKGGRPLYRDSDHLSRFGAVAMITPLLIEQVWPRPIVTNVRNQPVGAEVR